MRQMWKINVKSISCIAEAVLTSVVDVDANGPDSMDHKVRLSSFKKEALIEEVLKTWDPLAEAEASMNLQYSKGCLGGLLKNSGFPS